MPMLEGAGSVCMRQRERELVEIRSRGPLERLAEILQIRPAEPNTAAGLNPARQ